MAHPGTYAYEKHDRAEYAFLYNATNEITNGRQKIVNSGLRGFHIE